MQRRAPKPRHRSLEAAFFVVLGLAPELWAVERLENQACSARSLKNYMVRSCHPIQSNRREREREKERERESEREARSSAEYRDVEVVRVPPVCLVFAGVSICARLWASFGFRVGAAAARNLLASE